MKVGKYQIGRYHGIIKKIYEDGTYDYETRFSDKNDFMQSARAISSFLGDYVGLCTSEPKKLVSYNIRSFKYAVQRTSNAPYFPVQRT